ncbi:MAG TPA: EAL domain-containing protein [Verrucomicrobiae bacterium]|jgi:diguanylate cyclase (GGDEF)-like protein/PAS domain S-box-containing protein|nr:EAL domain-containing protein [Verrucomicrobiae bacterium]
METSGKIQTDLSTDDSRELARLAAAGVAVMGVFAVAGTVIAITTGDVASAVVAVLNVAAGLALFKGRQQALRGDGGRAAVLLVGSVLVFVLFTAPIPPPVPAMAAVPIMSVAFALSFLRGRRLVVAVILGWAVSIIAGIMVEMTPASPDLPPAVAAALRVGSMASVTGLVGLVLYRHRRRLERADTAARGATAALSESEARYRTVVEDVREVIFRIDADGRWSLLNRAWEELTGHPVADSIGRSALEFVHADDRRNHADLVRPVARDVQHEYRHELRLDGADSATIWVEVHARALHDDAGLFSGMSGTLTDISTRRALEERLLVQAFHDDLTGLANRALFKDRLEHALTRRVQSNRLVGLLYLDVDRFKTVNDSLGHTAGDALLQTIAARLRSVLRPEDTIARLGGDEFAILVEDVRLPDETLALAKRVLTAFDEPFDLDGRQMAIRASIGVVVTPVGERTGDELLRDADVAMYRAKVGGRGSYALFEPSMQADVAARMELESDLRAAIEGESLTLAYQPIVALPDGDLMSLEALARWDHPVRGSVSPLVFIGCAEEAGLIVALGGWVLRQACADVAELRRSGPAAKRVRLSVNVSPRQLTDSDFVGTVLGALEETGLPPDALDLEVTESVVFDCGEDGIERLRILRAAGVGVSLDDFGTGFSSLGNLRTLPIDQLKVDRIFVAALLDGGIETAVVEAVIRLGGALGASVVAEGIEDAAVANRLAELGCVLGQGFFFGRPQPFEHVRDRFRDAHGLPTAIQSTRPRPVVVPLKSLA